MYCTCHIIEFNLIYLGLVNWFKYIKLKYFPEGVMMNKKGKHYYRPFCRTCLNISSKERKGTKNCAFCCCSIFNFMSDERSLCSLI